MKNQICIQQVLHGYQNGHQLIESSVEIRLEDKRIMDVLSDSSGLKSQSKEKEYFTGYPLESRDRYVIAKTWYADEMSRPGCVWTHSLIFRIEDLKRLQIKKQILKLFCRPCNGEFSQYSHPVYLEKETTGENYIDDEKMKYVIYTIYNSSKNRYVEVDNDNYIDEILLTIKHMPELILSQFSFCTNSNSNRLINGKTFSYQMIFSENIYKVYSSDKDNVLYSKINKIISYPIWVNEYTKAILEEKTDALESFFKAYEGECDSEDALNRFVRLFLVVNNYGRNLSLEKYCDILLELFIDRTDEVSNRTYRLLVNEHYFETYFQNRFIEILGLVDDMKWNVNKDDIGLIAKKILNNKNEIYPIMDKYIHGKLKRKARSITQKIIEIMEPSDLASVCKMDHDITFVLITINNRLILSKEVWKESREFQCDMINALDANLTLDNLKDVLYLIIKVSEQDVTNVLYNKFGNKIVPLLFEMFEKIEDECLIVPKRWEHIMVKDIDYALCNILRIKSSQLREKILFEIDTYDNSVINLLSTVQWKAIFDTFDFMNCEYEKKKDIAVSFMPIVLYSTMHFGLEIVQPIFEILHQKLASETLQYDDWFKIELLLPQVEPCFAWDKCRRLRMAFENKNYMILY